MSHTDKDKPYWVRLNQESKYTDHDHTRLGKRYTRRRYLYDEKGQPLYVDVPEYKQARYIAQYGYLLNCSEALIKRAKELVGAGKGTERLQTGTYRVRDYEDVECFYPDHCTEGEPLTHETGTWGLPCHPAWPNDRSWWAIGKSKKDYLRILHGADRTRVRTTLRNMEKGANSWEDGWEDDYENVERLTNQYRHEVAWMMW